MVYDKDSLRREIPVNGLIKCLHIGHDISGTRLDAAQANWGHGWRMPTIEEVEELTGQPQDEKFCWREYGDKCGASFFNRHSNCMERLYIPAAGFRYNDDEISEEFQSVLCWSSTFQPNPILSQFSRKATGPAAKVLFAGNCHYAPRAMDRYYGLNIRPVISREDAMTAISNIEQNARVDIRAFHGDITVNLELPLSAVKVYTAKGTEIYHVKASGQNHAVKALPDGIYIVELTFNNGRHYTSKVIL